MVSRRAVSALFFFQGLCFASWGSRIPQVQAALGLSDPELGGILFALPAGLMISLPLSGWAIAKLGSQKALAGALLAYAASLALVGQAETSWALFTALFVFGLFGNTVNIAVNTQAVAVEALYPKPIMASFHGLWSLAGFTGAGVLPAAHFIGVACFTTVGLFAAFPFLIKSENASERAHFARPDFRLLVLGLIAFCAMICEGTMFDWSGVYFKKVVQAEGAWVGLGYTAFMCTMAAARFCADALTHRFGFRRLLFANGALTAAGFLVAVTAPSLVPATLGFLAVGAGVSSVVPLVYSAAGRSSRLAPSTAISVVSSIGFIGFLVGPPFIGLVAGASSLRLSILLVALFGAGISVLALRYSKHEH